MPHLYVDLDNNKLIAGSSSPQIAPTPSLYQGDKPTLELELITRTSGVMAQYTSAASAVNVRIGALGSASVASVLSLSVVTLSANATATVGLVSPVTATGTATLLGSAVATISLSTNNPSVVTVIPTVTTFTTARCLAYLGAEAISPIVNLSLTPIYDKYLDVVESGTPYESSATVYGTVITTSQLLSDLLVFEVPKGAVSASNFFGIFRTTSTAEDLFSSAQSYVASTATYSNGNTVLTVSYSSAITVTGSVFSVGCEFLTVNGSWSQMTSTPSWSLINLKNVSATKDSQSAYYQTMQSVTTSYYYYKVFSSVSTVAFENIFGYPTVSIGSNSDNQVYGNAYTRKEFTYSANLSGHPIVDVTPVKVISNALGIINSTVSLAGGYTFNAYDTAGSGNFAIAKNVTISASAGAIACTSFINYLNSDVRTTVSLGAVNYYSGQNISLEFEQLQNGEKQITGGSASVQNYYHRPYLALPKTAPVTIYPPKAYPERRVEYVEVVSCGSQYATVPSVFVSEPDNENGITAKLSASIKDGKINSITIIEKGSGYTKTPDVFILPPLDLMKSASARSVTSVISQSDRSLTLQLSSGYTMSDNSWAYLNGLGSADGLAYVATVASGGTQATCKLLAKSEYIVAVSASNLTPLIPYVQVTGAVVSGSDANYITGTTIPVTFSTPSCGDINSILLLKTLNSGQVAVESVLTPGFATSFSSATISAYKKISGLTVVCSGSGYWTELPSITIDDSAYVATAPGATPAVVSAGLNGDGTISLSLVSAGYGYTSTPSVTISAPNSGNGIRTVAVVTSGVGYSDGTFACIVSAAPAGGTSAIVNFVKSGTSQSFTVVNPGRGYTSVPVVVVTKPDLGGQVSSFTVTCKGAGYLVAPAITLTGGGGSGAAAEATIENGSIATISITTGGTGYTSAPAVVIDASPSSVYYKKQIDLSTASVTSILNGNTSASAYLQVEEKSGTDITVLAQVPITIQARIS